MFLAGGTDVVQLLKCGIAAPKQIVDISHLPGLNEIKTLSEGRIHIGALARLADVAQNPIICSTWPLISQALLMSAAPQVRNVATVGGNLLQRTRCAYFRDVSMPCNKRALGTGCPAINGEHRNHALFGTSDFCIASHPSDLSVVLTALDATVHVRGLTGNRQIPISELYFLPGNRPDREIALSPGELITAVEIPLSAPRAALRGCYLKVRDRMSFEFAVVSLACVLEFEEGSAIRTAQLAAGGVGTKPWRLSGVETLLKGERTEVAGFKKAAEAAIEGARPLPKNSFKLDLLKAIIVRALVHLSGVSE
jgi:xanthine dehydrogenase YagS FAD-binding subunit